MIDFHKASFIKSVVELSFRPTPRLNEILFVGKSNVGKSTLINALTYKRALAKVSSKPGHTKLLNYYLIDESFYLVDAPGYGYTITGTRHLESFGKMMEQYFENIDLKAIVFLLDSRHDLSKDDEAFLSFLQNESLNFIVVFTKCDKLNQKEKSALRKRAKALFKEKTSYEVSANDEASIQKLREAILKSLNA